MKRRAVFLDRDGVINIDNDYVHKPEQVIFMPGLFDFCREAKGLGYLLIIVTNQSGIGRGLFDDETFHALMRWMKERFEREHCPLDAVYFCPHHPEERCSCRKPKPGMIMQAVQEWNIAADDSMMIGDKERDIEAGRAAGVGRLELFNGTFPDLI